MRLTKEQILEARKDSKTFKELTLRLGVTDMTLRKWCKRYGIPIPIGEPYVPEPPAVDNKEKNNTNHSGSQQWQGLTGTEVKQPNTYQPLWMPSERNYRNVDTRGNAPLPGNPLNRNPNLGAAVKRHTV